MAQAKNQSWRQFLFSRPGLVFMGFLAVTGYFLWTEHQAHVVAVFLFQRPTLLTLLMFPVLVWMYVRLARQE